MRYLLVAGLLAALTANTIFTIPPGDYSGAFNVPSTAVGVGVVGVKVTLDTRNATDPATGFASNFEVSYDNGQTWRLWSSASYVGGVYLDKLGNPRIWSLIGPLEQPDSNQRRVRGVVTITGTVPLLGGTLQALTQ